MANRLTNYPNGFAGGVSIRNVPLLLSYPGNIFWVHSGTGSNGNEGTFGKPFGTIAYAISRCDANRGDIVMVKAGHVETVNAAGALTINKAGVAVVGMGSGNNRPQINFTGSTAADMNIDAANVSLVNVLLTGGIDALAGPIDVNAADFTMMNCEWRDVTGEATRVVLADAAAARMVIDGYEHRGAAALGGISAIDLIGTPNVVIRNFKIVGNFSGANIEVRTTAAAELDISNGYMWNRNASDLCIRDNVGTSTGKIGPSLYLMLQDNAANITEAITGAGFHLFGDIIVCNAAGEQGMPINWTASTDA